MVCFALSKFAQLLLHFFSFDSRVTLIPNASLCALPVDFALATHPKTEVCVVTITEVVAIAKTVSTILTSVVYSLFTLLFLFINFVFEVTNHSSKVLYG